jgi:hypothetical protein
MIYDLKLTWQLNAVKSLSGYQVCQAVIQQKINAPPDNNQCPDYMEIVV